MFLWGLGESMFLIFQPLYLQQWGASPVLIGTLLGANSFAMALAVLPAGYLADRWGEKPVMLLSWIIGMVAAWGMALANNMLFFAISMFFYYSSVFGTPAINSYVISVRGKLSVERALTLQSVAYNLGAVIGPSLGGWIGTEVNIRTIYYFSSSIFMISTVVALFIQKLPKQHKMEQERSSGLRSFPPRFWGFIFLSALSVFALYLPQPLNSNFLQNVRELDFTLIGRLGTIGNLGNVMIMLLLGNIPAYYGILISQFLVALFSLFIWKGTNFLWYSAGFIFLGGFRLGRSMLVAFARQLVDHTKTGLAYGFLESANAFAVLFAPLLAGFLYDQKPESIYMTSIVILSCTFLTTAVFLYFIQKNVNKAIINLQQTESEEA
ncbi:MAG: MFS transporter [Anaerolineaceae bacterium]